MKLLNTNLPECLPTPCAAFEALERRALLSVTPSIVQVPISAAALAADPSLANYRCFDVVVAITAGDKWPGADMRAKLSSGDFYNVPGNINTPFPPIWPLYPQYEFDTFVSMHNFQAPTIMPRAMPMSGGASVFAADEVDASWTVPPWQQPDLTQTQTVTIARLTVRQGSSGSIIGRVAQVSAPNILPYFSYTIDAGGVSASSDGLISGILYNDLNADRKPDNTEPRLGGRTIYVDANNNGVLDAGEQRTTSDSSGAYWLERLGGGNYTVRQIVPVGWQQTDPAAGGARTVAMRAGTFNGGVSFGSIAIAPPASGFVNDSAASSPSGSGSGSGGGLITLLQGDELAWP